MQNINNSAPLKINTYSFWVWTSIILIAGLVLILSLSNQSTSSIYWIVGIIFGITVQRSRFCFTSAFRDFFLLGQTRMIKGILVGLAVSSVGFVMIMSTVAPNPGFGAFPSDAHVLPVGLSTLIAGILFGIGMVLAGGCVSGSLYRMGEGYIASWVAILGVMIGLFLLSNTWNWWWDNLISQEISVWLPANLSYTGALIVTALGLVSVLYIALYRERKVSTGFVMPEIKKLKTDSPPQNTFDELLGYGRTIFRTEWSPIVGGVVLAIVNIILFIRFHPLGVVGEISRWSNSIMHTFGAPHIDLKGIDALGACATVVSEGGSWFTETFFLNIGIVAGATASAIFAREFKLRVPKSPVRYIQSIGGGIIMGYGAGLGLGCTLGAFFSAVPSMALNGWVYAIGLTIGSYLSVQWIKRFP
ncbi:MAG: YeeE/YedE family protein [Dehalococcoidia bacterium]|nr:YeeE/YedE family protein [Dehalococcoidia bacterium]